MQSHIFHSVFYFLLLYNEVDSVISGIYTSVHSLVLQKGQSDIMKGKYTIQEESLQKSGSKWPIFGTMFLILCIGGLSIYELYEILELKREILILKQETGAVYLEPKVRIRNAQNANEFNMHMLIYFIDLSDESTFQSFYLKTGFPC